MIDTGLRIGGLRDLLSDVFKQDVQAMKFQRWIAQGTSMSYKQFWGEEYGV